MYLLLIVLVISTRSILSDATFCEEDKVIQFEEIKACDDNSGPVFNCSGPMFDYITVMQNLKQNWAANFSLLSNVTGYDTLKILYDVLKGIAENYVTYMNLLVSGQEKNINVSGDICVDLVFLSVHKVAYMEYVAEFDEVCYWIDYLLPVICGAEFIFGMLGNISIVLVFLRYSDMRTGPNKVVFNLAVGDIFLLINNVALYYIRFRWMPIYMNFALICIMAYGRTVGIACSVYSMVVLSTLRYLATVYPESSHINDIHGHLLLTVWILAAIIGIPDAVFADDDIEFYSGIELKYIHLVFLCLLPLSAICIFSMITSKTIRASVRQLPAGVKRQRRSRQRGARVILYLSLLLCITYLPMNLYELSVTSLSWEYSYTFLVRVLLPINSCLNPVALFVGSQNYRAHLFKLIRCDGSGKNNANEDLQLHQKLSTENKVISEVYSDV